MIHDTLVNMKNYVALHPLLEQAAAFLLREDLAELPDGRHEIAGDDLFAMVIREPGRTREEGQLEAHLHYTDIQLVLSGVERMGWRPTPTCEQPAGGFDVEKDLIFYEDDPASWVTVRPSEWVLFFPSDAHLPMISGDTLHKVVLKLALG